MSASLARKLSHAIGVTRIADLTSLDRAGVPVACAIRPKGHVLQVSNGKGAHAELSAVAEAAELWAAEQGEPHRWRFIDGVAHVEAERLDAHGTVWVPAASVWCPPAGGPSMGLVTDRWTSNGMGAHPQLERALLHGLLELIERDALPDGWLEAHVRGRCIPHPFERPGFRLRAFDLTPARCPVPVIGALLEDLEGGPIPLTAGYACRLSPDDAIRAACEEAYQSRLTEVQGAREDVTVGERTGAPAWLDVVPRPRKLPSVPSWSARKLARALKRPVAFVELVPGVLPVRVVKVIGEGFRVSRLLG